MRRSQRSLSQRLVSVAVLAALSGVLTGCGGNFDPTDLLDFLDTKKKLPGDRKPVFPEGVPGLQQGVPKELYKGAPQDAGQTVASAPAQDQQSAPSKGRGAKSRGKPANVNVGPVQSTTPAGTDPDAAPADEGGTAAAPPAPKKKIVRRRTTAPPPDAAAAQPAPQAQSAAPASSGFPAPLPGTLQR